MSKKDLKFRSFVSDEPSGDWSYQLDDHGIRYGSGWWPFHHATEADTQRNAQFFEKHGLSGSPEHSSVRLLAGSDYCAGNQTYVVVTPISGGACAEIEVMHRRQGLGGMVGETHVTFPADFSRFEMGDCADCVRELLLERAEKVRLFLLSAIAERDAGIVAPVTAHERYEAAQKQRLAQ